MTDDGTWFADVAEAIIGPVALAAFRLTDPDERAHLARAIPVGGGVRVHLDVTPDGPILVVDADLGDVGRGGVVPFIRATIGDDPGDIPRQLLPAALLARLDAEAAEQRAALPDIPDTVDALLGG